MAPFSSRHHELRIVLASAAMLLTGRNAEQSSSLHTSPQKQLRSAKTPKRSAQTCPPGSGDVIFYVKKETELNEEERNLLAQVQREVDEDFKKIIKEPPPFGPMREPNVKEAPKVVFAETDNPNFEDAAYFSDGGGFLPENSLVMTLALAKKPPDPELVRKAHGKAEKVTLDRQHGAHHELGHAAWDLYPDKVTNEDEKQADIVAFRLDPKGYLYFIHRITHDPISDRRACGDPHGTAIDREQELVDYAKSHPDMEKLRMPRHSRKTKQLNAGD